MAETIQRIDFIATNPDVRGGRPCIAGTGIEVSALVVAHIVHGRTVDEIASDYKLSLAQVHAALAYYYAHKTAMDKMMRERQQIAQAMKEQGIGSRRPSVSG